MKNVLKNKLVKSSLSNAIIKPISMVLSVVYTPLLLSYLGTQRYGLWATILSVTSWIAYFDVGIGQGLRNLLGKEIEERDWQSVKKSVSTGYVCLTLISTITLIILILLTFLVNWNSVFKTSIDMRVTLLVSFIFICINFVLSLSNTLLYALQKAELVSLRGVIMQLINIAGLLILNKYSHGSLEFMAILFGGSTTLSYLFNSGAIVKENKMLSPEISYFDTRKVKQICNVGLKFFAVQITYIVMYTVDNVLITSMFGPTAAASYNIVDKIYSTGFGLLSAIIVPIWSGATAALARRDFEWFKKVEKWMKILLLVFIIGYIGVGLVFKPLASLWLGKSLDYPTGLVFIMCVYYIAYSCGTIYCQLNNGIGAINGQVIVGIIQGIINIPLAIYFAKVLGMGVVGIRLATTILVIGAAVFHPIYYKISLKKIRTRLLND